jgi:hypothetical protein
LRTPDNEGTIMRIHSMVGLIPLFAVEVLDHVTFVIVTTCFIDATSLSGKSEHNFAVCCRRQIVWAA